MLVPWKKSYDKPRQHIKKQRRHFANKDPSSQSYDISSSHVQIWELDHKEGCALNIDAGAVSRKIPWTIKGQSRRSNQSIQKEINPEYSLEGLMLKPKLQYFGHLMQRANSLEKTLIPWCWERFRAGGEGNDRGWDGWMASLTQWTWVSANSGRWWRIGKPWMPQSLGSQRVEHNLATEKQKQGFMNRWYLQTQKIFI